MNKLHKEKLNELWNQTQTGDWDGYDSLPVYDRTFSLAEQVIEILEATWPSLDFGAEPDGSITIEWYSKKLGEWSLSLRHDDFISYAGILGKHKLRGACKTLESIPYISDMLYACAFKGAN